MLAPVRPEKVIIPLEVSPVNPVRVPPAIRFDPRPVKAVDPPGESTISPVFVSPRVKVCLAVVARVPEALRYAPPAVPAEREAVGVPEFMFNTANLAEAEA